MTCRRALCNESEDKGETSNENAVEEKVPLAPDNGKNTDSSLPAKDQSEVWSARIISCFAF